MMVMRAKMMPRKKRRICRWSLHLSTEPWRWEQEDLQVTGERYSIWLQQPTLGTHYIMIMIG